MVTKDLLIEKLLKEKINNGKKDNISELINLFPSNQKKIEKEMEQLRNQVSKQKSKIKKMQDIIFDQNKSTQDSIKNSSIKIKEPKRKFSKKVRK